MYRKEQESLGGADALGGFVPFYGKEDRKEVSVSLQGGGANAGLGNKAPETSYKDPIVQGESRGAADLGDLV